MTIAPIKILHTADLHLGFNFSNLGEKSVIRSNELLGTFDKIIDICHEKAVDFLLISGDLFDKIHIEEKLALYIRESFSKISQTNIMITPGNHDPLSVDSWYNILEWPKNVYIYSSELNFYKFDDLKTCVWGAGFSNSYEPKSLWDDFNTANLESEYINIGITHAQYSPSTIDSQYHPINKNQISNFGFDYFAMGHVHKRTEIIRENNTCFAYSGAPEGHGFDELGQLGIYIGTISKKNCNLEFLPTSKREYKEIIVDVSRFNSIEEVVNEVLKIAGTNSGFGFKNNLYKIIIKGEAESYLNLPAIENNLSSQFFYFKLINETTPKIDLEELGKQDTLKGLFVNKMLKELESAKKKNESLQIEKIKKAIKYGVMAFDGEVIIDDYKENSY